MGLLLGCADKDGLALGAAEMEGFAEMVGVVVGALEGLALG